MRLASLKRSVEVAASKIMKQKKLSYAELSLHLDAGTRKKLAMVGIREVVYIRCFHQVLSSRKDVDRGNSQDDMLLKLTNPF